MRLWDFIMMIWLEGRIFSLQEWMRISAGRRKRSNLWAEQRKKNSVPQSHSVWLLSRTTSSNKYFTLFPQNKVWNRIGSGFCESWFIGRWKEIERSVLQQTNQSQKSIHFWSDYCCVQWRRTSVRDSVKSHVKLASKFSVTRTRAGGIYLLSLVHPHLRVMVGSKWPLQNVHVPMPGTCDYDYMAKGITLQLKWR